METVHCLQLRYDITHHLRWQEHDDDDDDDIVAFVIVAILLFFVNIIISDAVQLSDWNVKYNL